MDKEQTVSKKKNKKPLIIVAILLFVFVLLFAPTVKVIYEDAMFYKDCIFYVEVTEPKGILGMLDLIKYTLNMQHDEHIFNTTYDDLDRYNEPVWEYLLNQEVNKNLNDNYHVRFTTTLNGLKLVYNVYVDNNTAKIELEADMLQYDDDEGKDIDVLDYTTEWYLTLENNTITAYAQNADGVWCKTQHDALIDNYVAFDLDTMLQGLSNLEPWDIPYAATPENYPQTRSDYSSNSVFVKDTYERGYEDAPPILVFFSNYPEIQDRLDGVHRYYIPLTQLAKEYNLSDMDMTFDKLCNEYDITAREMMLYVESVGESVVQLPDKSSAAIEVDNLQFIADEIMNVAGPIWALDY